MLNLKIARFAAVLIISGFGLPCVASNLDRQLAVPYNNGTGGEARSQADQLVQSGIQAESPERSITLWQSAIEQYQQIGEIPAQARVYDLLGMAYVNLGRIDEAENAFRRGLAIARDQNDISKQIYGYNNVGQIILQRAQPEEAQRSFAEALRLARSIKHGAGQGLSLSNLGLAASAQGKYQDAIAFLEQAREFRSPGKDPIGSANTLNNLGDAYQAIGNSRSAYGAYKQAMFLGEQNKDKAIQFRALDGMMLAYRGMGQENRFVEALDQRLVMATQENDAWQVLTSLKMLAQHHRQQKDFKNAENYYQQAYAVARSINATQEQDWLIGEIGALRSRKFKR